MTRKYPLPRPVAAALRKLGEDIRDARRRRRITMALLAERAGITVITLAKIEKGHPTTSIGAYASALYGLGMIGRLRDIADGTHDLTGQMLADERLPKRVRIRRYKYDDDEPIASSPTVALPAAGVGKRGGGNQDNDSQGNDNNQGNNKKC